ncbi:MAG TPA: hypothetical protein VEX41_03820 [Candidatus Eisenbacteria bacterium]|nr:hypothetical protein [Candidatus Eisenbacteria bacterium]
MEDKQRVLLKRRLDGARRRAAAWSEPRGPHAGKGTEQCPVPATHDKLDEVHYFLHRLLLEFHHPVEFRWTLNAYLQASRSVLHMARRELRSHEGFDGWWSTSNAALNASPLTKRVIDSRNFVVHQGMLSQTSETMTGIFRGRTFKLGFGGPVPNDWYSENLLRFVANVWTGVFLDRAHTSIGEQFGIRREWRVAELGDGDVVALCVEAHGLLAGFVVSAHEFGGTAMMPEAPEPKGSHDPDRYNVLLETDLDPTLLTRWGW